MTGKKNKRGDRDSTEEETNAAKRPNKELDGQEEVGGNMADNDEVCDAEPTLYDIRTCWRTFKSLSRAFLRKMPS